MSRYVLSRKAGTLPATLRALALACAATLPVSMASADAGAKTARIGGLYDITVAGLVIGKGSMSIVLQGNAYSAKVGLEPAGIGSLFSTGRGGAEATGWLVGGKVVPSKYSMASQAANRDFYVLMKQGSGNIREAEAAPPFKPVPDRIEITRKHQQNAMDPLSAAVMPVAAGKDALGPAACKRKLPVFDGWTRFDIQMEYKEIKQVSGRGYDGPVVVCGARWKAIAGHRPGKESVKLMEEAQMEAWLAPMGRNDVLIPYRIVMPTASGQMIVEATKLNINGPGQDQAAR